MRICAAALLGVHPPDLVPKRRAGAVQKCNGEVDRDDGDEIVDGDTLDAVDGGANRIRIRVLGIDTPEGVDPGQPMQCWAPEAPAFATRVLLDQHVTVVTDPTQDLRDRYDRLLAYLYLPDGQNYSVMAAAAGMARAYTYGHIPVTEASAIAQAEQAAGSSGRGLWGSPCNGHT